MNAHVLLNLSNELRKRQNARLVEHLFLFRDEFHEFNNARARLIDPIDHMKLKLL